MSSDRPNDVNELSELGTPKEVRDARPALYPEHALLDKQARQHPEVLADYGPDDGDGVTKSRAGLVGVWNAIAYYLQYAALFVLGA